MMVAKEEYEEGVESNDISGNAHTSTSTLANRIDSERITNHSKYMLFRARLRLVTLIHPELNGVCYDEVKNLAEVEIGTTLESSIQREYNDNFERHMKKIRDAQKERDDLLRK